MSRNHPSRPVCHRRLRRCHGGGTAGGVVPGPAESDGGRVDGLCGRHRTAHQPGNEGRSAGSSPSISEPRRRRIARPSARGRCRWRRCKPSVPGGGEIDVPDGWVHHWRGAVLIPHVTLDQVFSRLQAEVPGSGQGDVLASAILARNGSSSMRVFIKVQRQGRFVVAYKLVYNTEHDVTFTARRPARPRAPASPRRSRNSTAPARRRARVSIRRQERISVAVELVLALRAGRGRRHRGVRVHHAQPDRAIRNGLDCGALRGRAKRQPR